jgi:hypothetical protein
MVIQMYWKQKERADKSGFRLPPLSDSIRVEVQLKNVKTVRKTLGMSESEETPVCHLEFFQCYLRYRIVLTKFHRIGELSLKKKCSLLRLIAECEAQGFQMLSGHSAWDWYAAGNHKPETLRRNKRAISKYKMHLMCFDWRTVLPVRLPAILVNIHPDGREERFESDYGPLPERTQTQTSHSEPPIWSTSQLDTQSPWPVW